MMAVLVRTVPRFQFRRGLVGWSAAALGLYLLGAWMGGAGALIVPGVPLHPTNSIGSVATVFEHNLEVLAWISAGAATLGLTTAAELFMNGTVLGFVSVEMIEGHHALSLVTAVGPQLPFELGAYVIAAGATLRLGWTLWWPLLSRRERGPVRWKAWMVAQGAAVTMLLAGAVVEVLFSHV
jgi:uncharacterized membrane protein SpoIIM required for sporulation